ncbi:MAG: ATPase, T2SS/T4P/T4SS family [Candidatus Omnitrophota bacterium]
MNKTFKDKLIEVLISSKLVNDEQLEAALEIQKSKGDRLSQILVSLGFVTERELKVVLSESFEIPPINLDRIKIDKNVLGFIPERIARFYQVIPLSKIGKTITIAMVDPFNIFALDDIKTLTGFVVKPVIATRKEIEQAVDKNYGEETKGAIEGIIKDIKEAQLEMVGEEEEEIDTHALMRAIEETPVVRITNLILANGVKKKASDIMIEPLEDKVRVRFRIDGILEEQESPPKSIHNAIISRIKVMSNLNIAERRLPQDGRFKAKVLNREVDFRVSVIPSNIGEKAVLRILDKSNIVLDIGKLGFNERSLNLLQEISQRPHGMILVCGPTGCGKTTTLYSILRLIHTPDKNIVTVEDPLEFQLEGINQVTVNSEIGLTFAGGLRSILRQDPDVIMIGEMRDYETIDIGIKSALTGHLVLSTLHTTDAPGSIVRMVNMGVEPFLISSSVLVVAAQRLIRVLCNSCKEEYEPDEILRAQFNLPGNDKILLYRPKGCGSCGKSGYKGRVAIIETMPLTPAIRDLIVNKAPESEIKKQARLEGMKTLRENGLAKVLNGITSIEEVIRVAGADQPLT